jgi:hypothetical protein
MSNPKPTTRPQATPIIADTPPKATMEPLTETLIPDTSKRNEFESEAEDSDDAAFANSNKTPRTPTKANNPPSELTMAPKKGDRKQNSAKEKEMPGTPIQAYMTLRPSKEKRAAEKEEGQPQRAPEQRPTKNLCNEATTDAIIAILTEARVEVNSMTTRSNPNIAAKEKVIGMLSKAIFQCNELRKNMDSGNANITEKANHPELRVGIGTVPLRS